MAKKPLVLMIEDTPVEAHLIQSLLQAEPFEILHVSTGREGLNALERHDVDLVLLDLNLPDMNGIDILKKIDFKNSPVSVIVLTGNASLETAITTMRLGVFDYVVKPFNADRLKITIRNALERQKLSVLVESYRDQFCDEDFCGMIGSSPAMQAVYRTTLAAAASKATVFITGESGTGKELCAQAIHKKSPRRDGPFFPINCAAIPRELLESQIFGHVKGAFSGATSSQEGAAHMAHKGTLFLDEVCEMPLELQAKLLRFVQTGSFCRVGSNKIETVDSRFVCATNRNPLEEVEAGRLREDLFYRLHVLPLMLPPLREREGDILAIARSLLTRCAAEECRGVRSFSRDAENVIAEYDWPGNVRQLQNVIRQTVVMNSSGGTTVTADMLPHLNAALPEKRSGGAPGKRADLPTPAQVDARHTDIRPLWESERNAIVNAIEICKGNIPLAARRLGVSPSTLYRKRQAWAALDKAETGKTTSLGGRGSPFETLERTPEERTGPRHQHAG